MRRSLQDRSKTLSAQSEVSWPSFHELARLGTHTSYIVRTSFLYTLLTEPSSFVAWLCSKSPSRNNAWVVIKLHPAFRADEAKRGLAISFTTPANVASRKRFSCFYQPCSEYYC